MRRILGFIGALFRHLVVWIVGAAFLAPVILLTIEAAGQDPNALFHPIGALFELRDAQGVSIVGSQLISSLVVSACVAAACLLFAPTAAYALSRARFPGRRVILTALALVVIAPVTLLVVPLEIVLSTIGLHDTYPGLVMSEVGLSLALSTWIIKRGFDRLPPEVEESARLEGATQGRIFRRIALPAVRIHVICATAIAFAAAWGEYLFATAFLTHAEHFTVAAAIVSASRPNLQPWDRFAPIALLAALPSVLLFVLVQFRLGDLVQLDRLAPRAPRNLA